MPASKRVKCPTNGCSTAKRGALSVLDFLSLFERRPMCSQLVSKEIAPGVREFPYVLVEDAVDDFIAACYREGLVLTGFDWGAWQAEAQQYRERPELLHRARFTTLQRILTTHIRADRFCDGHLVSMINDGHMSAVLHRLKVIGETSARICGEKASGARLLYSHESEGIMIIEKNGNVITSVADWEKYAGPKSRGHWKEDRSAYELARAWCGDGHSAMPQALRALLDSRPETSGLSVERVFPECRIRFDQHAGEPRNADLAFIAHTGKYAVAVTIEAKADEPFGATISKTLCDALERRIGNAKSRGIERLTDLAASLLQPAGKGLPSADLLCYQLLTATAGTLAYAIEHAASFAVLVIHEFVTDETQDENHARNATAYRDFVHRLCGESIPDADHHQLFGPIAVRGTPLFCSAPPLFIGKITTRLRRIRG